MIRELDIEHLVKETISDTLQLQKRDVIKDSPRSTIARYSFSSNGEVPHTIIVKEYHESTHEMLVYAYFQAHHLLEDVLLHCEAHGDHGYLVLRDISGTHHHLGAWEPPLPDTTRIHLIQHLAQWYSTNWQHYTALVHRIGLPWHLQSLQNYTTYLGYLQRDTREFRNNLPFSMTHAQLGYYDTALEYLHQHTGFVFDHLHAQNIFTWIHGDLNVCNVYYPVNQRDSIVLLDYEAFRVGLFTDDFVMLWIHDLYHGASHTRQIFQQAYQTLSPEIHQVLTPSLFDQCMRHSLSEGLFFPMKLFAQYGVKEKDLVMKSIDAYEHLVLS
jgi:hypothetical protein